MILDLFQNQTMYQNFNPIRFGIEITYVLIIFLTFLFLYFKTKKLYDLSTHEGIKNFRYALLFFSLAFLSRFLFNITRIIFMTNEIRLPGKTISLISLIFITYFSTMAIGYLIYSLNWKKLNKKSFLIYINSLVILFIFLFSLKNSVIYFIILQIILLLLLLIQKITSKLKILYSVISLFWIFNIIVLYSRNILPTEAKLIFQLISIITLAYLSYKILKWAK